MSTKQPAEDTSEPADSRTKMTGSEDSDDETSQEEQPVTPWNELSIVERVGLNGVEMTEAEVEAAFSQISLAFHCDRYTLKQRLQAEEHARNLAEENIHLELTRGRETLETLKALCLDSKRSDVLQSLELCLDILGGTVERISNTAEVLGAVHQEARVSRAVELMVAHVDNLRRRHDRDAAELEEAKKLIQWNARRHFPEPRIRAVADIGEDEESQKAGTNTAAPPQKSLRRRVSTSVISRQSQEKKKRERVLRRQNSVACLGEWSSRKTQLSTQSASLDVSAKEPGRRPAVMMKEASRPAVMMQAESRHIPQLDDTDRAPVPDQQVTSRPPDDARSAAETTQVHSEAPPTTTTSTTQQPKEEVIKNTQSDSSTLDTLRHRRKSKALLEKRRGDKDKMNRSTMEPCGPTCRHRPLVYWLYQYRWLILCVYLFVFCCMITLTLFVWNM